MYEGGGKQSAKKLSVQGCFWRNVSTTECRLRLFVAVLLLSWSALVFALQSATLSIGKIITADWALHDVSLALTDIEQARQQWTLQSAYLQLPSPLDFVSGFKISCGRFQWREGFVQCSQGRGRIESARLKTPEFGFSFQVQDGRGTIDIIDFALFGGRVSIAAQEQAGVWRLELKGERIDLADVKVVVDAPKLQNLSGKADLHMIVQGRRGELKQLFAYALLNHLTLQVGSKVASEEAALAIKLSAAQKNKVWQWRQALRFEQGGLYVEPVYLEAPEAQAIELSGQGVWRPDTEIIEIHSALLQHPQVGKLEAEARLNSHRQGGLLEQALLKASISDLSAATPIYLTPFLEAGPFAGITLTGQTGIALTLQQSAIDDLLFEFEQLGVDDSQQRFQVIGAKGKVNWRPEQAEPSYLDWQGLKLKTIPVGPGRMDFITEAKRFTLRQQSDMPLLGGELNVNEFSIASVKNGDADVHFSGALKKLSLEQLSEALGWTPLSGEISGRIPAVTYRDKKLGLDGKLTMQVFDGEVTISKLASSGMFTDFAQFYADIDLDNLDLNAITRKFQFGSIEGRLSGYAHNLYLENWHPVSFYAWFGTPEDDDSRHRISQKAVENIASIGGGGAADAISRGVMRFFDNFGYNRLGFGCYLYNGVCQMMGVEAADNGYYLVKGGGLPRIDVIGYNPRLDWNVLLRRLSRITATDQAVVE